MSDGTCRPQSHLSFRAVAWSLVCLLGAATVVARAPVPASAQESLRIAYPTSDATVPGPDVPVSITGGAGSNGGAIQVTLDGSVQEQPDLVGGILFLRDVPSGDHRVEVRPRSGSESAATDGGSVSFTVLPALTASMRIGICDGFNPVPAEDLGPLSVDGQGAGGGSNAATSLPIGVPGSIPVLTTESVIDAALDTFLERAHSITVSLAGDDATGSDVVLCGEVGGVLNDGVVRIGLSSQDDAEAVGVATLLEDGEQTRVRVEVVQTPTVPASLVGSPLLPSGTDALTAAIRPGVCAGLGADASFDLEPLRGTATRSARNPAQGVALAPAVIASTSQIAGSLGDLLARAHAIGIRASTVGGSEGEDLVACGTVGGPVLDGTLRIALLPTQSSGYAGTATFTESGDGLTVDLHLVRGQSLDEDLATGSSDPAPTSVTVTDSTGGAPEEAPVVEEAPPPPEATAPPEAPVEPEVPTEPEPPTEPEIPSEPPPATEPPPVATEAPTEPIDETPVLEEPTPAPPVEETVPATEAPPKEPAPTEVPSESAGDPDAVPGETPTV